MNKIWLMALVFLAVACGGGNSVSSGTPERHVAATPSSTVPNAGPTMATPVGGVVKPRKVPFTKATATADGLKVEWTSGVEPCYSLDRVDVEETGTQVKITLWEGTTDPDAACIEIAIDKATLVKLAEPLGTREVLDGAKE